MALENTPLDLSTREIRLLSIQPGLWDDEIICSLDTISLDQRPHYDALSYVWGDATTKVLVLINGQLTDITPTVKSAIRRLRQKSQTRVIWIDQICIEQSNDNEKMHQVQLMVVIYKSANEVWAWLGDEEETRERGYELKPRTVEESSLNIWRYSSLFYRLDRYRSLKAATQTIPLEMCSDWESLSFAVDFINSLASGQHFYNTPYFSLVTSERAPLFQGLVRGVELLSNRLWWERVWVVQELLLASKVTVVLESRIIPWSTLEL